jgi:uncharacterized protein (DUF2236 family)
MAERLLPYDQEVAGLVPGPGSAARRLAGDARTLLGAGYALVLQVSHPIVAAGVAEHSRFADEPWARLTHTLDFIGVLIYAEPATAAACAREMRARHRSIRGKRDGGASYSALEPGAYAWVWATLFDSIVSSHRRFGLAVRHAEEEELWEEWRRLGRLLGVRPRDLPAGLAAFEDYREEMVQNVLGDNPTVREVLAAIARPAGPPLPMLARPAWSLGRIPLGRAMRLATSGLLPASLRERLQLRLSPAEELELLALSLASRSATPLMPHTLRAFAPAYLRLRRLEAA